ncbi:MAG: Uma2 family endonuclease [Coleofasciculaceae cyanobacterium]
MIQAIPERLTFPEFLDWRPENRRYELHRGVIVEMSQPKGKHEEVIGFLARKLNVEFERLNLPYFIPNRGEYQVKQFRGDECLESLAFPELNLRAQQIFLAGG